MEFHNGSSSIANRDAFRRSLQSSLHDVLGDISQEEQPSSGSAAMGRPFTAFQNLHGASFGHAMLSRPSSLLTQSLGSSSLFGGMGAHAPVGSSGQSVGSDPAAYLLLAKATEDHILNRAKSALLQQTIVDHQNKQAIQEAYIQYLQNQLASSASTSQSKVHAHAHALSTHLFAPHFLQNPLLASSAAQAKASLSNPGISAGFPGSLSPQVGPVSLNLMNSVRSHGGRAAAAALPVPELTASEKKKKIAQTLKALGTSLRSRYDPFIDCIDIEDPEEDASRRSRGGVSEHFPERLHRMLLDVEQDGKGDVVAFMPHGRAFAVIDETRFVDEVMPKYFKQSKWNSFARQLNLYGFVRMASGPDAGAYYHELFLKSRPSLCKYMRRVGVPQGQQDRRKCRPKNVVDISEPSFYDMRPSILEERAAAPATQDDESAPEQGA
jgi:HSF-type DNA-binding